MATSLRVCLRPSRDERHTALRHAAKQFLQTMEGQMQSSGWSGQLLIEDWEAELPEDDIPLFITMDLIKRHDLIMAFVSQQDLEVIGDNAAFQEELAELRPAFADLEPQNRSYCEEYLLYALKVGTPLLILMDEETAASESIKFLKQRLDEAVKKRKPETPLPASSLASNEGGPSSPYWPFQPCWIGTFPLNRHQELPQNVTDYLSQSIQHHAQSLAAALQGQLHRFAFHRQYLLGLSAQCPCPLPYSVQSEVQQCLEDKKCQVINLHGPWGQGKSLDMAQTLVNHMASSNLVIHACRVTGSAKHLREVMANICTQLGFSQRVEGLAYALGDTHHKAFRVLSHYEFSKGEQLEVCTRFYMSYAQIRYPLQDGVSPHTFCMRKPVYIPSRFEFNNAGKQGFHTKSYEEEPPPCFLLFSMISPMI